MAREKSPDDIVVVWKNTSNKYIHRDTGQGGLMMKPGAPMAMEINEREGRGRPPRNVTEEVMTRKEAWKRYGKKPTE